MNPRKPKNHKRRTRLMHELLEPRQLLAGDAFSPWTHPIDPADTNSDGEVSARDALAVINELSRSGAGGVAATIAPPILGFNDASDSNPNHLDSTGDGEVTVRDALLVINRLALRSNPSSLAESESASSVDAAMTSDPLATAAERLEFSDDFARVTGILTEADVSDTYSFLATRPRASVDLNSVWDESIARIRVLDSDMTEIADSVAQTGRQRFEGMDFATSAGGEYLVVVELAGGQTVPDPQFDYALSVFQFEPSRWLPESSGEVTVVGGNGDLGDTIATAATVPIRPNGSSFTQTFEHPGDVDVIRLPNALPGSVFVSGLAGIRFELLSENGDVLTRSPSEITFNDQSDLGYYSSDQSALGASDSVYLRVFSSSNETGQYNVSVLFDGGSTPPTSSSVIDLYDESTASQITFTDGTADVNGATDLSGQTDFYRFTTSATRANVSLSGDEGIQVQFFRANDQRQLIEASTESLSLGLPGQTIVGDHEIILAVWNPRRASSYGIEIELFDASVPDEDLAGSTFETAADFPLRDAFSNEIQSHVYLETADDIDVYQFTAAVESTRMIVYPVTRQDDAHMQIPIQLFDGQGQEISRNPIDQSEQFQELQERLKIRLFMFETVAGEDYFLRFENSGQGIVTMQIRII